MPTGTNTTLKRTTKVILCGCKHEYQDKRYGLGRRVHNLGKQAVKPDKRHWSCTVCGNQKSVDSSDIPKEKAVAK